MPGLPFQSLAAPETMVQQQFEEQKKQLQQRFELAWNEINKRGQAIGQAKRDEMLTELHGKAKMEALKLTQSFESNMGQLKQMDEMEKQGLITNAGEAKLRMILGPEAERYLPKGPSGIEKQFSELDTYENRLEEDLKKFSYIPPVKPTGGWFARERPGVPGKYVILDSTMIYNKETETWEQRKTPRDASPVDLQERELTLAELKRVQRLKSGLLEQAIALQKGGMRLDGLGAFTQQVAASVQPKTQAPTGNIKVRSLDGKVGSIPAEDWDEAQKAGYTRI